MLLLHNMPLPSFVVVALHACIKFLTLAWCLGFHFRWIMGMLPCKEHWSTVQQRVNLFRKYRSLCIKVLSCTMRGERKKWAYACQGRDWSPLWGASQCCIEANSSTWPIKLLHQNGRLSFMLGKCSVSGCPLEEKGDWWSLLMQLICSPLYDLSKLFLYLPTGKQSLFAFETAEPQWVVSDFKSSADYWILY